MAEVGQARPGYELWRPNRESATAQTTKAVVALVLFISAGLLVVITLGGWERLQSGGVGAGTIAWAGLYVVIGLLVVGRWNRGLLPVAASLAVIMVIFAVVAAPSWFARDKTGLDSPAIPEELLGLLTLVVIPVQLLLVAVAMIAFSQNWHVEEERPIGGGPEDGGPGGGETYAEADEDYAEADEDYAEADEDPSEPRGWTPPDTGTATSS